MTIQDYILSGDRELILIGFQLLNGLDCSIRNKKDIMKGIDVQYRNIHSMHCSAFAESNEQRWYGIKDKTLVPLYYWHDDERLDFWNNEDIVFPNN